MKVWIWMNSRLTCRCIHRSQYKYTMTAQPIHRVSGSQQWFEPETHPGICRLYYQDQSTQERIELTLKWFSLVYRPQVNTIGSDYLCVAIGFNVVGVYSLTSGHLMTELVLDLISPGVTPTLILGLDYFTVTDSCGVATGGNGAVTQCWQSLLAVCVARPTTFVKLFQVCIQSSSLLFTMNKKPFRKEIQWKAKPRLSSNLSGCRPLEDFGISNSGAMLPGKAGQLYTYAYAMPWQKWGQGTRQPCSALSAVSCSASFIAEISVKPPWTVFTFIIRKNISWIKVS